MKMTSRFSRYSRLLNLNARLFLESFKLDAAMILVGLLYVFGGRSELNLTVSKGVFLLVGFLFTALMESQIIKRNTANLPFYLRLPMKRKTALALFYLALTLPIFVTFTTIFLLFRFISHSMNLPLESSMLTQRYYQVIFAIFFIKSLTINSMIAMSIHFALLPGYFIVLGGVLFVISILQEFLMPLFVITKFTFMLLFLLSTYLISFMAVKKIGL